jgi:hypothetical protein
MYGISSSYEPNPEYSYNRSGGRMTITNVAGKTGRYVVRFGGLSALLGTNHTVHVSGFNIPATYCEPVRARLERDAVEVRCFAMGTGAAANADFSLLVASKREDRAFAYAHQPTATDYSPASAGSWNPAGTSRVFRDGVGRYRVVFNGLGARLSATVGGHLQVNAVGTAAVYCKAIDGWGGSPNLTVNVGCFTPAGVPVDAKFSALFALPAPRMGYAWADQPSASSYEAVPFYSWSPVGGGVRIYRLRVGVYSVDWNHFGVPGYANVQVTAWGDDGAQCKAIDFAATGAGVQCFAANGVPMDAYFTVLVHH